MEREFCWESLTKIEQQIIWELYEPGYAINSMQVYFRLASRMVTVDKNARKVPYTKALESAFTPKNSPTEMSGSLLNTPRRESEKILMEYRNKGIAIPAYTTIIRMLEKFVKLGWVSVRKTGIGRASSLYFLPLEIRKVMKKSEEYNPASE